MSMRIMKEYLGLFAHDTVLINELQRPGEAKTKIYFVPFKAVKYSTIVATSSEATGALKLLIILLTSAAHACFDNAGWFNTIPAE
jgi:hypothetical protein